MKKQLKIISLVLFFIPALSVLAQAQDVEKNTQKKTRAANISSMITSRQFTFDARSVSPTSGATRQLTSAYDLRIKGDTVICYLPYFGRAYSAPINSSEAGINFTSKDFEYLSSPRRKGGWNILIKPRDVSNVQQLNLSVSENGQASLQVTSNSRQPISFMGTIKESRK